MDADLIVVGAGQSGLATAFAARRAGRHAIVLESSETVAGSWPRYYDSLRLFSPARYSAFPRRPFPGDPERHPTRDEVVDYLAACAEDLGSDLRLGDGVKSVAAEPDGVFSVRTSSGAEFRARALIAATGSFESPHRPRLPGLGSFPGQVLHAGDYRTPASVAGKRVVMVGGGNSAVQIAVELAQSVRVTLASRSPLRWIAQRPLGRDLHWWLARTGIDTAPIGRWLRRPPVLDDGSYRAAITRGRPDHRLLFDRFEGDEAVWADGTREPFDAAILATGYRPHLPYLAGTGALDGDGRPIHRGGLSRTVPGLGYAGLEHQRSIASATLRGVTRDAEHVLRRLQFAGTHPRPVSGT